MGKFSVKSGISGDVLKIPNIPTPPDISAIVAKYLIPPTLPTLNIKYPLFWTAIVEVLSAISVAGVNLGTLLGEAKAKGKGGSSGGATAKGTGYGMGGML